LKKIEKKTKKMDDHDGDNDQISAAGLGDAEKQEGDSPWDSSIPTFQSFSMPNLADSTSAEAD
jgi:hypothetical protein